MATDEKPIDTVDTPNTTSDSNQTEEELKLALRVQSLFRAAYNAKQQLGLHEKWRLFDDYKHSRQTQPRSPEDPNSVTNIIHPIIESQIADMVDKPYAITAKGQEVSDDLYSNQVQHMLQFVLERNKVKTKLNLSEHDRLELGTSIYKVYFDDDALDGRGLPTFDVVNPANFFPDPKVSASYLIQDAEFIIHATPKPLSWFRKKFPKKGKYVQRQVSVLYDPSIYEGEHADEADYVGSQRALCIECYMKDDNGELYCVTVAQNLVLEDTRETMKKKKVQRQNKYPFVVVPCYVQRGMIWGQSDVELLIPTQDLINELDDQIRINARLMGNPQIAIGMGAGKGFDFRKWTSMSGLRIPMRDQNAFRIVEARPVSPDVPARRDKAFQEADLISGRPDVNRGEAPRQVTAFRAIAALQQAGQKGVLHKKEMFKEGFAEVLSLLYDEMLENWTEELWVRIEGQQPDYKFYDPRKLTQVQQLIPNAAAGPNEDTLIPLTDEKGQPMTRDANFDFTLSIGDGLPNDKAFIYETLLDLSKLMVEGKPVIFWHELRKFIREEVGIPLEDDEMMQQPQMGLPQGMPGMPPQGMPMMPPMMPQGGVPFVG